MSESRLSCLFKVCATCARWGGQRTTDVQRQFAIFRDDQKGECCGGALNHGEMIPIAHCGQWEKWGVLKV